MANPPSNLKGEYDENLKNDSRWVDYDLIMGLFAFYGFTPSFNDSHENICGIYSRVPASRGFAVRDEIFCWQGRPHEWCAAFISMNRTAVGFT